MDHRHLREDAPLGFVQSSAAPPAGRAMPLSADMPDLAAVQAAIHRLRQSERMASAAQLRRFFDYIVAESLAGRGDKLKAYSIATGALGRPEDFDPGRDPIVRVEATRLRGVLAAYYADEGRDETLRLRVPPGSYQPVVEFVAAHAEPAVAPAAAGAIAAIGAPGRPADDRRLVRLVTAALVLTAVNTLMLGATAMWLWTHAVGQEGGGVSMMPELDVPDLDLVRVFRML